MFTFLSNSREREQTNNKNKMEQERNCAFQYAKIKDGFFRNTTIVCDKTELTIDEAKELWNKYYPDAARWIHEGSCVEMVIWINMQDPKSYGESLQYISTDAESDGNIIWETKRSYFTTYQEGVII